MTRKQINKTKQQEKKHNNQFVHKYQPNVSKEICEALRDIMLKNTCTSLNHITIFSKYQN